MSKNLVAFFSASGTTKKVAEMIAEEAKADLFEIEPKVPYTKADLDWMNKKSRSSVEMSDKKYRPEIMKKKMDMSSYDEILLGFPIWWYVAPTIVNTFLEAYDFSGKKIVLFATSGGSGFGNTVKELQPSAPDAVITEGRDAVEMKPGDCINIPVDVKHWHGAAPDGWFSHLAIEVPGVDCSNEWCEAVSEKEYAGLR